MHYISDFFNRDRAYFSSCKTSITAQNNRTLVDGCIVYACVLAFYTVLSITMKFSVFLKNLYFIFDGIHLLLCAAVFSRSRRLKKSFAATQFFCVTLEITILSFFALEGAFASQTQPSLYVPIAILLIQLLFIHNALYSLSIIFAYCFSFAVMACLYKQPEAYTNDIYIAVATFIAANIGYMLIAKLRRSEQQALTQYEILSRTDGLTGLNNKAALTQLCQNAIAAVEHACTLIIVDLDDFKTINDRYGHSVGGEVLMAIGDTIKHVFRSNDILGRFGGDEFVILVDACDDPAVVRERVGAFQRRVYQLSFSAPALRVCCSAGAAFKRENDDFSAMFSRADRALYAAKREGKNQICFESEAG